MRKGNEITSNRSRCPSRGGTVRAFCRTGLFVFTLATATGCDVDVQDGVGPRVPVPNVVGTALRQGAGVGNLDVELRDAVESGVIASTQTDDDGTFEFDGVPAGTWEVKVSGDEAGDFDSVSREILLDAPGDLAVVSPCEVSARGASVIEPAPGAALPVPNPFQPITFRWVLPDVPIEWARAQLYTESGDSFWSSERDSTSEVAWNGIGTEGEHAGQPAAAGTYSWRVKVHFPDGLEGRLDPRELILQ